VRISKVLSILGIMAVAACSSETKTSGACGDGVTDIGEECDGADLGGQSCIDLGYYGGNLVCNADCTLDKAECTNSGSCGDGVIQAEKGEVCDTAELGGATCLTLGYNGGTLTCTTGCELDLTECEAAGICGDGQLQSDYEECEESSLFGATCESLGYYGGTLSCVAESCVYNLTSCEANGYCGNGVIEDGYGEDCDSGNLGGVLDCLDYDASFYDNGGDIACSDACEFDLSACAWCGDGIIQSDFAEECDSTNFGGLDCASLSFALGALNCTGCVVDYGTCSGLTATMVAASNNSTCILGIGGNVWCWGTGTAGQLGNGDTATQSYPVLVAFEHGHTIQKVSGDSEGKCALDTAGQVWCWGLAVTLGDGSTSPSSVPVQATFPAGTVNTDIGCGVNYCCAVDTSGDIRCWGTGSDGQLGDGQNVQHLTPTLVTKPAGVQFASVTAAYQTACALTTTGAAYCWGYGLIGTLGNGTTTSSNIPVAVSGGYFFNRIAGGDGHFCAITAAGTGYCWGAGTSGQLGNGTSTNRTTPYPVTMTGVSGTFADISAGFGFSCAVATSGEAYCWGNDGSGQLGNDALYGTDVPGQVVNSSGFTAQHISCGGDHACLVDTQGRTWCWGGNTALGNGTTSSQVPVQVADPQ